MRTVIETGIKRRHTFGELRHTLKIYADSRGYAELYVGP